MSEQNIPEIVKNTLCEYLGVTPEQVTPDAEIIRDLGADSLDTIEVIMALEEELNVEISDEEAEKIKTVQEAIDALEKLVKE